RLHQNVAHLSQAPRGAQHLTLAGEIEPVAGFNLDRRDAFADQRIEPTQRLRHQRLLAGLPRRRHRRRDAAAGARDLLIRSAGKPQLEFAGAIAAVDEMGMAINQSRRNPAALAINALVAARRLSLKPREPDAAALRRQRATLNDAKTHAGAGREPGVAPQRQGFPRFHAKAPCLRVVLMYRHIQVKRFEAPMTVLHFARALTPDGWRSDVRLTLAGARIGALEFGVAPQAGDERHALGLPALANLHSHAFQRAMAGLAERRGDARDTFWTWRETMYRFALTMDPDQIEATAAQLYVEMLEAGFSAVAEFHYLHNAPDGSPYAHRAELAERIAAAAAIAGIGLTLLPVFYAHATFGGAPPRPEQRRFITDLDGFARLVEDCRPLAEVTGVAPHSLRAVTP